MPSNWSKFCNSLVELNCIIQTFAILHSGGSLLNFEKIDLKCNTRCVHIIKDTSQLQIWYFKHEVKNSFTTIGIGGIIKICS